MACLYCLLFAASAGYSEEEFEEKQQELRNQLDEQFGQNMMAIKESMSKQYQDSMKDMEKKLELASLQVSTS